MSEPFEFESHGAKEYKLILSVNFLADDEDMARSDAADIGNAILNLDNIGVLRVYSLGLDQTDEYTKEDFE